jgi:hypothetical protein
MSNVAKSLPLNNPAEVLKISPEFLEVANCYLEEKDVKKVADSLGLDLEIITEILARGEVVAYVNGVYASMGFNNKFKLAEAMDALIKKKFMEMEEAETGSTKDIAELLAMKHKMVMDEINAQIKLETLKQSSIRNQINVQVNDNGTGSNYERLIKDILQSGNGGT